MAQHHQTLSGYSGSLYGRPRYQGIEYDWEVPDNLVVGSPGGVSTIHHHYTKGFDGRGNTSSDVYAGQGERYNSGVYGNLYQTGQEAGQHMGYYPAAPDYQFWQNEEPQQYAYSHNEASTWAPAMTIYGEPGSYQYAPGTQKKTSITDPHPGGIERYTSGGLYETQTVAPVQPIQEVPSSETADFEIIQPADVVEQVNTTSDKTLFIVPDFPPWLLFIIFLLAFVAFYFWARAGHMFVKQRFHKGKELTWKQEIFYAIAATILFMTVLWASHQYAID